MGPSADVSLAQRQSGLGAFESLTLALFVAAEHQGLLGRVEIEAHDVPEFFLKLKVFGELEIAHPVGLQLMGRPEPLHARFAQAGFTGHRAHAPRPAMRSPGARQTQGPSDSLRPRKPWLASPPRGVLETLQAPGGKALPPTSNGQKTHRLLLGDLFVGESLSQPQDDPSPEHITLAAGLGLDDTLEFPLLTGSHFNRYSCWHDRQPTKSHPDIQSYLWDITLGRRAALCLGSSNNVLGMEATFMRPLSNYNPASRRRKNGGQFVGGKTPT